MTADVASAILSRRATKYFDPAFVMPQDDLKTIFSLTRRMPTPFNIQNWRFITVTDRALRTELRQAAWDQPQITDASALIILCADLKAWEKSPARYWENTTPDVQAIMTGAIDQYFRGREQIQRDEGMRSGALAAAAMMLTAQSMGYNSCPMTGFDPDAVAKLIRLPDDHAIVMFVALGKALTPPRPCGGVMPDAELFFENRFPG